MEAGHLATTIEMMCEAVGIKTYTQYGPDKRELHEILSIDRLEEGVQLAIALCI
jgi:hypothetical protein